MALFDENELRKALEEIAPKKLGNCIQEAEEGPYHFIEKDGRYGNVTNDIIKQALTWDFPRQF